MSGRSLRHSLEYWAFRVTAWKWRLLPEAVAVRMGAMTGLIAGVLLRVRRADVDRHLAIAFPDQPQAWRDGVARASYAHLGRELAMLVRMADWGPDDVLRRVTKHGEGDLRRAVDERGGVVLLTGHVGNWEMAGAVTAASGFGLDVVSKGMANRRFEADLFALRERLGMRVVPMERAPRGALRALAEGRILAMLGDQNAHKSDLFVPFFGRPAATARGPALFGIRARAPIFYGEVLRDRGPGHTYTATVRELPFTPSGDLEADTHALTEAYLNAVEDTVRRAPEQYFWQHRRWKTRPPEEPAPEG